MRVQHKGKLLIPIIILLITGLILVLSSSFLKVYTSSPAGVSAVVFIEDEGAVSYSNLDGVLGKIGEDLEGLYFESADPENYALSARFYTEDTGWIEGTKENLPLKEEEAVEALIINQSGAESETQTLYYRCYLDHLGWSSWVTAGEPVGDLDDDNPVEALEIKRFSAEEAVTLTPSNLNWAFRGGDELDYNFVLSNEKVYPHNTESFTEGLFFYDGKLYESAGLYGPSKVYKNINLENGVAEAEQPIDASIFAEGSSVLNGKLYLLSYKENKVLVLDPETLAILETHDYNNREGWGLTTDGEYLITSDGSNNIYFMNEALEDVKTLQIMDDEGDPVNNINELEYIDGLIWANIWQSEEVIIINPENGEIVKELDFSDLYDGPGDVMNGIAYQPETNKIYFTGKNWDSMYEFDIIPNILNK